MMRGGSQRSHGVAVAWIRACSAACRDYVNAATEAGFSAVSSPASLTASAIRQASSAAASTSQPCLPRSAGGPSVYLALQHQNRSSNWSGWAAAACVAGAALASADYALADASVVTPSMTVGGEEQDNQEFSLLGLELKQRIFFKYEKRIRTSPMLEKVFSYFATQERDGTKYMMPHDLLRAVVHTYPPHGTKQERAGFLDGERAPHSLKSATDAERNIFSLFDVNGDGLLSYFEFLLVITLLSIPMSDVKAIFDVVDADGSGFICARDFHAVLQLLHSMSTAQGAKPNAIDPEKPSLGTAGLMHAFFGPDQTGKLSPEAFHSFVQSMHEALVELEFAHYDVRGSGRMLGIDFARSLSTSASLRTVDKLLDKANTLPLALAEANISYEEFHALHQMHRKLPTLQVAMDFMAQLERPVTKVDFARLVQQLTKVQLSPQVLDIIFHVFDNDHGSLNAHAFLDVMQRREVLHGRKGTIDGETFGGKILSFVSCVRQCGRSE